jgi:NAD(P)-dependent dehydrogenase (short-subunit alcohol dehydrogenase family)/acyl carrier protein
MDAFGLIVSNPANAADHHVVIAATRSHAVGVLYCAGMDAEAVRHALARIQRFAGGPFGVRLDPRSPVAAEILAQLPAGAEWVVLTEPGTAATSRRVLMEVSSAEQAARAAGLACHGLIARGEALARELAGVMKMPVWVTGITPDRVAACQAAGIAGVLIEQPPLRDALRRLPAILRAWQTSSTASGDAVMLQFQQLMAQFLEVQAEIMTAYLAGRTEEPSAAEPPAAPPDCLGELQRIASQRTGHPPELLDPDAALEADLGIDSLKRLEILKAFQNLCTPDSQQQVETILDQLAKAHTLREIAELLAAQSLAPRPQSLAPAAAGGPRNYLEELLSIASQRTGYPLDMLDPDAALEADLKIDSLKRVEILSAFQKLGAADEQKRVHAILDALTSAATLREIAERIAAALPGSLESTPRALAPAAQPVPRFVLTVTAKPRRHVKPKYYPGRISILTDDETGIAAGIAEELNRAGERAILLRHNPDTVFVAGDLVSTDLTDPEAVASAVGAIRQEYGPVGAIMHLLPLRGAPLGDCTFAAWRELVQLDVRSLYALARAAEADLKQTGRAGGALFAVATARGGDFGLHPDPMAQPTHYAAADFTKALALEFTGVLCKVVDVDATDPVRILQKKLIEELTSPDDTLQVGLPGDRRLTVVAQVEPLSPPGARQIQPDWVCLLTGGARGITAEIARHLAAHCRPVLVLVGASPLPAEHEFPDTEGITETAQLKAALAARFKASQAVVKPAEVETAYQRLRKEREIRHNLQTLRQMGSRVVYHSVDVRNEAAFSALLDGIYRDYGRLDVVIHGAGIIEDRLIRDKTPESFNRVVDTKADSTFVLSRKLRPESLQCLLFMSSVTAAFGNRAQADCAAADGIMNGFAARLAAHWPGRVVAMNWGPWDHAGMVTAEVRQQFLARCVHMIPLAGGADAALREIQAGPPHDPLVAVGEGPWSKTALPVGTPRLQVHAFGSMP